MTIFILSLIFAFIAILAHFFWSIRFPPIRKWVVAGAGLASALLFLSLHFIAPSGRQVVLMDLVFGGSSLEQGRLIATSGERGLQADILYPGLQFYPFINLLYNAQYVDYVVIPQGRYGLVSARDGLPLKEGAVIAPPVPVELFLDAKAFMDGDGDWQGTRGTQTTILRPGAYPINTHLFNVDLNDTEATVVPNGFVAVIKSAVNEGARPDFMTTSAGEAVDCSRKTERTVGTVSVELVPVGCRGTWEEPLSPGTYFLNRAAYEVTLIETRTTTLTYRGGYPSARIDLDINNDGSVTQERTAVQVPPDPTAAGPAIKVIVEGWPVYQDVRVQVQISPTDAPATVAAIGGLNEVRDRFITPDLRSIIRTLGGGAISVPNKLEYDAAIAEIEALEARIELLRAPDDTIDENERIDVAAEIERLNAQLSEAEAQLPSPNQEITRPTLVLDFVENRAVLERLTAEAMRRAGENAGARIVGVKFGNPDIPPELLVARKREQLADQFRRATVQERLAQRARIETEREKATADQQGRLVTAQIGVKTSKLSIEKRTNEGEAERSFLEQLALGEKARVEVIGEDKVFQLRLVEAVLEALKEKPELLTDIKLPSTVVAGGGDGGLAAAASILGATDLFKRPAAPAAQ